jgi:hypothetical protein
MVNDTEIWVVDWFDNNTTVTNGNIFIRSTTMTSDEWFTGDGKLKAKEQADKFAEEQKALHPENEYTPRKLTDSPF